LSTRRTLELEQGFYDRHWNSTGQISHARELERVELTASAVPSECKLILDIGCGDGRLCQVIRRKQECFLVGVDLSMTALRRAPGPKCCASAAYLPFRDRAFDLVISTEMLEHLPEEIYRRALKEISRVARDSILISVPNKENLSENLAFCPSCGSRFHIWGHLRSFSLETLRTLFKNFQLVRTVAFGEKVETYNSTLLSIRQNLAGGFAREESTACYYCGSTRRSIPRIPLLERVCDSLNTRFLAPFSKRRPAWLLGLYSRCH